ncbi:CoA pyrophosphatase [Curvibacter sp. CHRR-16]|uniref:CoA pyrophosphatase n=1 Tax=Curvibacter sp. CHRR-16 TaxID=2835872 RepID=UPI001BD955E8|nr:CoA pyrophosphatase [Curvibacter sp. CHRR-16]MBT0568704.1 CoA pyrophosphatase [Curvibacter sp. CHRR-16]
MTASRPQFDPRTVPVVGVDAHLPPVPEQRLTPAALRARFAQPLAWEPEVRAEPAFVDTPPKPAAVLVGLVLRSEPTVLLTQRTAHLRSHAGQIAFPGGKVDADDADAIAAALREAHEEVGLPRTHAEVLGTLPPYLTGTGYAVTPVVALLEPAAQPWQASPGEVDAVFEVPLSFLMTPAHHRRHALEWQGTQRQWWSMPWTDASGERFIWGATAGMLRNLYRFLMVPSAL